MCGELNIFLADVLKAALVTVRCGAGSADSAAMVYKSVAQFVAFLRGYDFSKSHLYFGWLFYIVYKSDAVGKADGVSICYNGRLAEDVT